MRELKGLKFKDISDSEIQSIIPGTIKIKLSKKTLDNLKTISKMKEFIETGGVHPWIGTTAYIVGWIGNNYYICYDNKNNSPAFPILLDNEELDDVLGECVIINYTLDLPNLN